MAEAVRIGTRGSALALVQARAVAGALEGLGHPATLVEIETAGTGGDKSRFVREIDAALLAGEVDLAVHSAKDVPAELPAGLAIAGVPAREDPRDALCLAPHVAAGGASGAKGPADGASNAGAGTAGDPRRDALARLPEGAVVGTASPRRRAQLLAARPDLEVRELRGNVDTRLGRLAAGSFDAAVLALAGLRRLGRADAGTALEIAAAVPAAGQGCLALAVRADDPDTAALAARLSDRPAAAALAAERALVAELGADCHTPVGAHATVTGAALEIETFVGAPDGSTWIRDRATATAADPGAAGRRAAERLLAAGAADILA